MRFDLGPRTSCVPRLYWRRLDSSHRYRDDRAANDPITWLDLNIRIAPDVSEISIQDVHADSDALGRVRRRWPELDRFHQPHLLPCQPDLRAVQDPGGNVSHHVDAGSVAVQRSDARKPHHREYNRDDPKKYKNSNF